MSENIEFNAQIAKIIGIKLSEARMAQQLTTAYIANETKIRERQILAIEQADFSNISIPIVYVKAFIKKYADFLKINIQDDLDKLTQEMPKTTIAPNRAPSLQLFLSLRQVGILSFVGFFVIIISYWSFYDDSAPKTPNNNPIVAKLDFSESAKNANIVAPTTDSGKNDTNEQANIAKQPSESIKTDNQFNNLNQDTLVSVIARGETWARIKNNDGQIIAEGVFASGAIIARPEKNDNLIIFANNSDIFLQYRLKNYEIPKNMIGDGLNLPQLISVAKILTQ